MRGTNPAGRSVGQGRGSVTRPAEEGTSLRDKFKVPVWELRKAPDTGA